MYLDQHVLILHLLAVLVNLLDDAGLKHRCSLEGHVPIKLGTHTLSSWTDSSVVEGRLSDAGGLRFESQTGRVTGKPTPKPLDAQARGRGAKSCPTQAQEVFRKISRKLHLHVRGCKGFLETVIY